MSGSTPAAPPPRRNPLAVAALAVACLGLPFTLIPVAFVITVPLGLAGVVLGLAGRRAAGRRGRGEDMATVSAALSGFVLLVGLLGAAAVWNAGRLPPEPEPAELPTADFHTGARGRARRAGGLGIPVGMGPSRGSLAGRRLNSLT